MSAKVIATIKLAPGQVGFYDPLSRIHLTLGNPVATVYSGTNCAALRRNVKAGIIRILEGTLGNDVAPFKIVKVGDKYKLASNSAEENKPVYAEDVVPKEEAEIQEQAPAASVEIKPVITPEVKEEVVAEGPLEETVVEEVAVAEEAVEVEETADAEEEVVEETSEEVKTSKKKRSSKKKTAQTTEE